MKTKNWKTVNSKTVFECKYFKINEKHFVGCSGNKYKYYILKENDYVVAIPLEKNYLYLVEFSRYTTGSRSLEFVAGMVEKNETPLQSVKKELVEEAGITAKEIKKIGWYYAYKGRSNQKAHIFLAENLSFEKQKLENLEKDGKMEVKKLKISEVKELIKLGKIDDVDTLAAFNIFMLKFIKN